QKDHIKFGRVSLVLNPKARVPERTPPPRGVPRVNFFIIEVEGQRHLVANGECLEAFDGDRIKVVDVIVENGPLPNGYCVNFKGFVPRGRKNTGEDRGYVIHTAKDLMKRYSLSKTAKIYAVSVEKKSKTVARMTIRLKKPRLDYIILRKNSGPRLCVYNGESLRVKPGDQVQVLSFKTNGASESRTKVSIQGNVIKMTHSDALLTFKASKGDTKIIVTREGVTLGRIHLFVS
ncbi:MAG: hypothetical protein JRI34_09780, partial [Deltaproteobacteria bacterium]|nr:hypothetical protein [Deltaproteobacteria bacterium]